MMKEIQKLKSLICKISITDCHSSSTIKLHMQDFHKDWYVHSLLQPITCPVFISFWSYLVILWEKSIFPVLFLHEEDEICQNNHGGFWKGEKYFMCQFQYLTVNGWGEKEERESEINNCKLTSICYNFISRRYMYLYAETTVNVLYLACMKFGKK